MKAHTQFLVQKVNRRYGYEDAVALDSIKLYIKPCVKNPTISEANYFFSAK